MVKKSSFLEKLKSRLRHSDLDIDIAGVDAATRSGGTRVNGPEGVTGRVPSPERARIDPVPAVREPEAVTGRKMSQREEATVAIQDGFRELTSLLRGMQNRVEDQGERFSQAADGLAKMPVLQEAQLELLRQLADRMERQNRTNEVVAQSLGDLPQVLGHVREALDRAAATDERTAHTLADFRANMDRIQGSMEQMVDHSRQHASAAGELVKGRTEEVRDLADSISSQQQALTREAVARLEATQRESVRSLRDAQADQSTRIGKMLEEGTKTGRAVLILLGLTFLGLVTIAFLLASR